MEPDGLRSPAGGQSSPGGSLALLGCSQLANVSTPDVWLRRKDLESNLTLLATLSGSNSHHREFRLHSAILQGNRGTGSNTPRIPCNSAPLWLTSCTVTN